MKLRIDRLTTLYVVDPILRYTFSGYASVAILMYHSIADEDESSVHPYYRTVTAPVVFAAQMESLHQAGFSVVGLPEAIRRCGEAQVVKTVVITFDDGLRNFYTNAFPVLNRYGFTATMFLPTAHIGDPARTFKGKECLSWSEIRELQQHGISFGSHTVTHPQLYDCDAQAIENEIVGSKQAIEQNLGCAVQSFSYPYAFPETDSGFKKMLREKLCQAGYKNGVCTTLGHPGPESDPLFLKRLPVNSDDDARFFLAKLAGSYDWLAGPQYVVKMAKAHAARFCRS